MRVRVWPFSLARGFAGREQHRPGSTFFSISWRLSLTRRPVSSASEPSLPFSSSGGKYVPPPIGRVGVRNIDNGQRRLRRADHDVVLLQGVI